MATKKTTAEKPIDPEFVPVIAQAFTKRRDVTGGRSMSAYGLRVDELVDTGDGQRFGPGNYSKGRPMNVNAKVSVPTPSSKYA